MISIDSKQLTNLVKRVGKDYETALYRSLNTASRKSMSELAKDVNADYGFKIGTVKRRIRAQKAYYGRLWVTWFVSGRRMGLGGLRKVTSSKKPAGISFLGDGRQRKRMVDPVRGGSKPFIIKGKNSGKKIAVFVSSNFNSRKTTGARPHPRKVRSFAGHSLPYVLRKGWEEMVNRSAARHVAVEFRKEIRKIKR